MANGNGLPKAPTGIAGLDDITCGGLPRGRPTLVCGAAGCGKTLLGLTFLVRGALNHGEPGVFLTFEETAEDLAINARSLGIDLDDLAARKLLSVDFVHLERAEIEETGDYNLDGLFIRLAHAVETVGAKRVVIDTLEALFAGLSDEALLRAELRRLFRWIKDQDLTAVITGESGEHTLTRYGLEEYVADCVIVLENRVVDQSTTRHLRVVKYRGSTHGTNEYPFMIGRKGISVLPITSLQLDHAAPTERMSTGVAALDGMLGGEGVFRGSSILVSGAPGTGKSSLASLFAHAACLRGERCLLFVYEESQSQLLRNMRSIGVDLAPWITRGSLRIEAARPTLMGLEQHLVHMHELVTQHRPAVVVVDPISNLTFDENDRALKQTLMRLIDFLKREQITALFTHLSHESAASKVPTHHGVSSLMDTWLLLSNLECNAERTRTLQVLKARGMAHSNRVREFTFSDHGVDLLDVFMVGERVVTGRARQIQQKLAAQMGGRA